MLANNGIDITVIVNNRIYIVFLLHFSFILNIVKFYIFPIMKLAKTVKYSYSVLMHLLRKISASKHYQNPKGKLVFLAICECKHDF